MLSIAFGPLRVPLGREVSRRGRGRRKGDSWRALCLAPQFCLGCGGLCTPFYSENAVRLVNVMECVCVCHQSWPECFPFAGPNYLSLFPDSASFVSPSVTSMESINTWLFHLWPNVPTFSSFPGTFLLETHWIIAHPQHASLFPHSVSQSHFWNSSQGTPWHPRHRTNLAYSTGCYLYPLTVCIPYQTATCSEADNLPIPLWLCRAQHIS